MKTKDKLLALLQNHSNEWISGEEIAASLSVTRAAVWKTVTSLRNDGYIIDNTKSMKSNFEERLREKRVIIMFSFIFCYYFIISPGFLPNCFWKHFEK